MPDAPGKRGGRRRKGIQAIAFLCVFLWGERQAVVPDEAGDGALWCFNLIASLVALPVDHVQTVAQVGIWMLDDEGFVVGAIDGPRASWTRGEGADWRLL